MGKTREVEMTERESHFLCLLKGCKWKGWITDVHYYSTPDAFFTFKEWMEKNMLKEWEEYLYKETHSTGKFNHGCEECRAWTFTNSTLNDILNLSNLVAFLVEHREEWGVVGNDEDGFIFHPALVWWDKEE